MTPSHHGSTEDPRPAMPMPHAETGAFKAFNIDGWRGEIASRLRLPDLESALEHLRDPGSAVETIHWGRNYLYRSRLACSDGDVEVVVKQFRNLGIKKTTERRLRGSKAERSWRMARAYVDAGIPTAEPLVLIESTRADGPSFFVTRYLPAMTEARYIFRAVNEDRLNEEFPGFDYPHFLDSLGSALRYLHEAGLFHRDLSIGNVLFADHLKRPDPEDLLIIDLNRGRRRERLSLIERTRDLCRLTVYDRHYQRRFVDAYWTAAGAQKRANALQWGLYLLYHYGFRFKIEGKKTIRAPFKKLGVGVRDWLKPRRAHIHLPEAPDGASSRDKIVWDHLSDQPHQHASKAEKLKVRLADAPGHLVNMARCARALPAIRRRYRQLKADLYRRPLVWQGVGICVRPWPDAPNQLMAAIDELGVRHVLLRLHPWQETHDEEEALAQELHAKGYELAFALPQNRLLVRDPELWSRRVEELARRFTPYGRHFQVGQAINRSKWGIWRYGEYFRLARIADEILRRYPNVEIFGPGVIDFELYSTASVVRSPACPRLDGLASLLYVDRRGAPENRQMGFDTVDKVLLCQAIADTSRACDGRSWITEVNWPLNEGPHSPAGKSVAVSEEDQAMYLTRYFVLALTTGAAERVYWWQLIARGYGLISPRDARAEDQGLRRRPAFYALKTLNEQLAGCVLQRRVPSPEGTFVFEMDREGKLLWVGWSTDKPVRIDNALSFTQAIGLCGAAEPLLPDDRLELVNRPRFFCN